MKIELKIIILTIAFLAGIFNQGLGKDQFIVYTAIRPEGLGLYKCTEGTWKREVSVQGNILSPVISEDKKWLIYTSDEQGVPHLLCSRFRK